MNERKPHVHAETIKAWADGADIELKTDCGNWARIINPEWLEDIEYRVKPEPFAWLESQDFYEVCQQYRHAKDGFQQDQVGACEAFEQLKQFIRFHVDNF